MRYVKCKDCKKAAEVVRFSKGPGYFTRSVPGHCDCGTDQRRGKARQNYLINNMADTIEDLDIPDPEPQPRQEKKPDPAQNDDPKQVAKNKKISPWPWVTAGVALVAAIKIIPRILRG